MQEPRILTVAAIDCDLEPKIWAWADSQAEAIDAHWARQQAANPHIFDGKVLLLHRGGVEGTTFRGAYLETRFSRFLAWRDFGFPDPSIRNCFAMAALASADGAYILGEMAAHTANPGRIYFPSGTPDPSDLAAGKVDLEGSVRRELEEETGLSTGDVVFEDDWTLVMDTAGVACMKSVRCRENAARIVKRIGDTLAHQTSPELAGVRVVRHRQDMDGLNMPRLTIAYLGHVLSLGAPGPHPG
jgi:8-oxo-dGTP pyrophosphatase MutT (NUDIX family)